MDARLTGVALRLLSDLTQAVEGKPDALLEGAFPSDDPGLRTRGLRSRAIIHTGDEPAPDAVADAVQQERAQLLEAGARAVAKLEKNGEHAELDDDESDGLEAIINLSVRPAIRIIDGRFLKPSPPWEGLERFRAGIEATARSVGRVGLTGNPLIPYAGTGSMVADGVVMTNRHVAKVFASSDGTDWVFETGMSANVSWADDPDSDGASPFSVRAVIGVHPKVDLALLAVEPAGNATPPPPVTIASEEMDGLAGRKVYALGYPAFDPRNGAEAMRRIFGDVYNVKRLQPGEVMSVSETKGTFDHDCSTLGGNSGSCVIDLDSNLVIGLHFAGKYLKSNNAVALWRLADDPMLKAAGVNFD